MTLNRIEIGERLRKVRVENYRETRTVFAERCNLSENCIGKIERGNIYMSIHTLNKICTRTGISADYLLYGIENKNSLKVRTNIDNFLNTSTKKELKMYLTIISAIKENNTDEDEEKI